MEERSQYFRELHARIRREKDQARNTGLYSHTRSLMPVMLRCAVCVRESNNRRRKNEECERKEEVGVLVCCLRMCLWCVMLRHDECRVEFWE